MEESEYRRHPDGEYRHPDDKLDECESGVRMLDLVKIHDSIANYCARSISLVEVGSKEDISCTPRFSCSSRIADSEYDSGEI